jgi:hypothetical protein
VIRLSSGPIKEIDGVDCINIKCIGRMSDHGLEDHWRIVTIGSVSQINDRDELRGEKEELKNLIVLIPQLV